MPNIKPDPWYCATCGKLHPVPSMARHCELKHEEQGDEPGTA